MLTLSFVVVHENNKVLGEKCRFNYLSFLISWVYYYFTSFFSVGNRIFVKELSFMQGMKFVFGIEFRNNLLLKYIIQIGFH